MFYRQVIGILGVVCLLGLSWVTGYLISLSYTRRYATYIVFIYFTLHGILGLCLFLTFFVLRSDARATWWRCCKGKGLTTGQRGAVKANGASTVGDTNYRLVRDKVNGESLPPESERILPTPEGRTKKPTRGGVGYDYSADDVTASRMHNHYRILPDTESSPVQGLRKAKSAAQPRNSLRIGEEWVTNTRV